MDTFNERVYNKLCTLIRKGCVRKWQRKYENKKPVCELKREYGLADATIYRWINEYGKIKTETGEITNNHEIKRLKKENLKLKEELEILKKAIAIFTPK